VDNSGVTQPVSISSLPALTAGSALIGKVGIDQTTPGTTNAVSVAQIGATTISTGNGVVGAGVQRVAIASDNTAFSVNAVQSGTWNVTNAGTFAVQIAASATSIGKAEDVASADGDVGTPSMAVRKATPANTSGTDGDYEMLQMSAGRLWTSAVIDTALPAGTALIGKVGIDQTSVGTTNGVSIAQLGANTIATGNGTASTGTLRVSIASDSTGQIAVASVAAGTNTIGDVGIKPRTTGGLTTYHLEAAGSTNAAVVKASAGQLFGWFIYNNATSARKVAFHNTASTPTAGASIFFTIVIPAGAAANVFSDIGIAFSSGIAITTVTGLTDASSAAVTVDDLNINLFYA
jgi:hypothetical protein